MSAAPGTTRFAPPAAARPPAPGALRRAAFTLIELLVVMLLIITVIGVTLPAVSRIIESNNYAAAVNLVTSTLGSARSTAMQTGQMTAVAFLFDTTTQRYTLVPLEMDTRSGSLTEFPTEAVRGGNAVAFRPARNAVPVDLPRGTGVFGLSFAITPEDLKIDDRGGAPTYHWYSGEIVEDPDLQGEFIVPWLFPRNDPLLFVDTSLWQPGETPWFDENGALDLTGANATDKRRAVRHADTFCVVFSDEGSVVSTFGFGGDLDTAYIEYPELPYDRNASTPEERLPYDDPGRFDPEPPLRNVPARGTSNPEVKIRPAHQLAIVDLQRLAAGAGFEKPWLLHSSKGKVFEDAGVRFNDGGGEIDPDDLDLDEFVLRLSDWIDRNAEIIGFDRYTGAVMRRQ